MLEKAYDPQAVEDRIYAMWEKSGAFKADRPLDSLPVPACPAGRRQAGARGDTRKKPFTISMPPPNATGQLHLGHAVMLALEDIFIRFARMRGKEALWVPGTDHAAIATENVVIKQLKEQGIRDPRKELGREKLVAKIAEFVEQSKNTIRSQIRKMGSSCDWSRERYTFEPALNRCVNEVFIKMYEDGLIYRGHRIVNFDPKLQTTVSDDEVVYTAEKSPFYIFKYGPFEIGTSRPETKFGDKYVVIHPSDERYKKYRHGETFEAEWINGKVCATIINDEAIDPSFGTGVMTITPWHDHTDFEIAERHKLEREQIIGFDGKLLAVAGEFAGMPIEMARPLIVEKLRSKGLLVKTDENYVHNKAVSQRGGGAIEPQIKLQWFIDVNKKAMPWKSSIFGIPWKKKMSLKEIMQSVVRDGSIEIIPERFKKTYFHWIDNLRDWCISRQIWWGHRVPVFYCPRCSAASDETGAREKWKVKNEKLREIVSVQPIAQCPFCGGSVTQDEDTLDTWFSSAMWTWSTLVDPKLTEDFSLSLAEILKRSPDFQRFHPTSVMETGYDILFFWVARMILMTTYATGQIPFKTVYLHGLIRTRDGRKMSKSDPSTMIDPLDMIAKYGADALRLSMIVGQSPGNDSKLYEEKIAGYRNFVNKLWNASRFVLMCCENSKHASQKDPHRIIDLHTMHAAQPSYADTAILSDLQDLIREVTDGLEHYRLSETGERMYSFVWGNFCDWYLECKKRYSNDTDVLIYVMRYLLILLHPYCPFVTEELWEQFKPRGGAMLMQQDWPKAEESLIDRKVSGDFQIVIDVISAIRSIRSDDNTPSSKTVSVVLVTQTADRILSAEKSSIEHLAKVHGIQIQSHAYDEAERGPAASVFTKHVEVHVPLAERIVDAAKEKERLTKEKGQLQKYLAGIESKLGNQQFVKNAPAEVVENEKQKAEEATGKLMKIEEKLTSLR